MPQHFRTLILAPLLFATLVGCSGSEPDQTSEASENGETSSNGTLTVGVPNDQYVLEGDEPNFGMTRLNPDIFETLTYMDEDYQVQPMLATDWQFNPPNSWTFDLREGVQFHNGEPMTAQTVKEGLFDRWADRGGGRINAGEDSVRVIDDHTLEFTPTETNRRVPEQLAHPSMSVVAPDSNLSEPNPIGTGPFQFVEYEPEERVVVERFGDYWGESAELGRIEFRFFPESATRRLALEGGEIDVMFHVPRAHAERLSEDFTLAESPVGTYRALTANAADEGPLQDERLRKAVAYAIDREALIDDVLEGRATDSQTLIPESLLGQYAENVEGFQYDPERARSLIEEAGWTQNDNSVYQQNGRPLSLTIVSGFPSAEDLRPVPEYLQAQLSELGIEVEVVETPDSATFYERMAQGEGDLWLEEGNQNDADVGFNLRLYNTREECAGGGSLSRIAGPGSTYNDLACSTRTVEEPEEARRITADALSILIDDRTNVIPLVGIYRIYALDPSVNGFTPHPAFVHVRWGDVSFGGE